MRSALARGVMLILLALLSSRAHAAKGCHAPAYHMGHVRWKTPASIFLNISIPIEDFAPDRLICVAQVLKQRFADHNEIIVFLYDSPDAARHDLLPFSMEPCYLCPESWPHNHASYSFDAAKREEHIDIMPFGEKRMAMTVINLPATSPPVCAVNLSGRCLLALSELPPPFSVRKPTASGTVTLGATSVENVRVVDSEAHPSEERSALADQALQNLKTWRFEAAAQAIPIRITYSNESVASPHLFHPQGMDVKFQLPSLVEITTYD